jgi:hypothetical protein
LHVLHHVHYFAQICRFFVSGTRNSFEAEEVPEIEVSVRCQCHTQVIPHPKSPLKMELSPGLQLHDFEPSHINIINM